MADKPWQKYKYRPVSCENCDFKFYIQGKDVVYMMVIHAPVCPMCTEPLDTLPLEKYLEEK